MTHRALTGAGIITGALLAVTSVSAADSDFYKDKQLTLICSADAGGLYDTYSRVLAKHLPNHIPGKPTVIVQNMPGASGLRTTNHIYNVAPRDGTVIAGTHSSVLTAPQLSPEGANFDVTKLSWIGSVSKDPFVAFLWHTAPAKTLADAKTIETIVGGGAVGSASIDYAIVAREMLGYKLKIVTGYKGSNDTKLAIERGELHGTFGNGWTSLKTAEPTWLKENKVRVIAQFGLSKHAEMPDVPLFVDLAKDQADRQALELMFARQEASKPYFAPPEVPAERTAILRTAFEATMKDPAYLAEMEKVQMEVDGPMKAGEVSTLVGRLAATPPSVVKRLEAMFNSFRDGKKS
jgi:tripartite-type tricarboxylate transporter receptor subunit TctC